MLLAFFGGREVGMFAARHDSCPPLERDEFASITFSKDADVVVTLNTNGTMMREASLKAPRPGRIERRVSRGAVRAIANRLVMGCFLERQPPYVAHDGDTITLTLSARGRMVTCRYVDVEQALPLCGGNDDVRQIAQAIENVADADVKEEILFQVDD